MRDILTGRKGTGSRRLSSSAAAVLVAVVLVAGCSGAAEEQPPVAATEAAATASPSRPAAAGTSPQSSAPQEDDPAGADEAGATTQASPGGPEDSAADVAVEAVVITITDFSFDVPDMIAPGTVVRIRNEDRVGHTVTSDEEGLFDVLVGGGQEETFIVPDQPGEFSFFCKPHPNMVDALVIG